MKLTVTTAGLENSRNGQASDVVLIHGTGSGAEMWKAQVDLLVSKGYRCFLPDLRGHGLSPEPEELTNLDVHLADLEETLADLELNYPIILVGHSLGAIISLNFAQKHPERVKQIFAVGMPGKVPAFIVSAFRAFMNTPFEKLRDTDLLRSMPWRQQAMINTHRHALSQIVENFAGLDFVSKKFDIACPVHFAVGRFDPVAPHTYVVKIQQSIPNSTLQVFEFAGHNCMDQYPKTFNNWLNKYLQ